MGKRKINMSELKPLLDTETNTGLAERFGVTVERIRQIRKYLASGEPKPVYGDHTEIVDKAEFLAVLGKIPDSEVSKRFSVPVSAVFHARTSRKIPSHSEARREEVIKLLPTMKDPQIMEKFGYSKAGVSALRAKHYPETKLRKRKRKATATATTTTEGTVKTAVVSKNPMVQDASVLPADTMDFLLRRHKAGDSTEALAARLEIPETKVRQALGLA